MDYPNPSGDAAAGQDPTYQHVSLSQANERSGHMMVSDYRRPRLRATPEELQVRCLPLRWIGRRRIRILQIKVIKNHIRSHYNCQSILFIK